MSAKLRSHEIRVLVQKGSIKVSPDPLYVDQGAIVVWLFAGPAGLGVVDFEVYFSNGSPLKWTTNSIRSDDDSRGHVTGAIRAVAAEPGDYKYGVRATAVSSNEVVADDDPYLIVRAR